MLRRGSEIPIFTGGDSEQAIDFGARHADMYMLWGEPLAGTAERIESVRQAITKYDQPLEFSLSLRIFLGETDDAAWEAAHAAEQVIVESPGTGLIPHSSRTDASVGRARQLASAEEELHDDCFWTRLVTLLGGFANSAALVGTPDRVLESLARYRDLGVDAFLLTTGPYGIWDPDIEEFARRVKHEL